MENERLCPVCQKNQVTSDKWCPACREQGRWIYLRPLPDPPRGTGELDEATGRERIVLFHRINGLGDLVQIIPAMYTYQQQGLRVVLSTQPTYAPLLRRCPWVERVEETTEKFLGSTPTYWSALHCFDLEDPGQKQFDFCPEAATTDRITLIKRFCEVEDAPLPPFPWLHLTDGDREMAAGVWRANQWGEGEFVIGLCLRSESSLRTLSLRASNRLRKFLEGLFPAARFLEIGNDPRCGMVLPGAFAPPLTLLAGLIARLDLLVTVDTGPLHLAGALGTSTLALFSEVPARLRVGHYPTVAAVDHPEGCPHGWPCRGGCLGTVPCLETLPLERVILALDRLEVRIHYAECAPRSYQTLDIRGLTPQPGTRADLYDPATMRVFYQTRPDWRYEVEDPTADRLQPSHYEYPRVQWVLARAQGRVLLDVGTGAGRIGEALGHAVEREGWAPRLVCALEPHPGWAYRARERINGTVRPMFVEDFLEQSCSSLTTWGYYDTVVFSDVLEHLQDPAAILAATTLWLHPRRILATTPIGFWEGTDEHLWNFTEEQVRDLMEPLEGTYETILDRDGKPRWFGLQIDRPLPRIRG